MFSSLAEDDLKHSNKVDKNQKRHQRQHEKYMQKKQLEHESIASCYPDHIKDMSSSFKSEITNGSADESYQGSPRSSHTAIQVEEKYIKNTYMNDPSRLTPSSPRSKSLNLPNSPRSTMNETLTVVSNIEMDDVISPLTSPGKDSPDTPNRKLLGRIKEYHSKRHQKLQNVVIEQERNETELNQKQLLQQQRERLRKKYLIQQQKYPLHSTVESIITESKDLPVSATDEEVEDLVGILMA